MSSCFSVVTPKSLAHCTEHIFNNIVVETQAVSQGLIQLAEIIISIFYIIIFVCVAMLTDPFLTLSAAIFTGVFFQQFISLCASLQLRWVLKRLNLIRN